ncbi:hypothetical protein NF865_03555 [Thermococcus aggregans]|uniref:Uncharacterized protein n=1 Tax=Thermococcus aggregans TaxID=110163 RepID=A0A9E7MYH6_THEAG|nr:hypothetical protein [Thermococcus aggregans]USS41281.1 hypothetical protein NF865_03555 [Thermococcus aggregans]
MIKLMKLGIVLMVTSLFSILLLYLIGTESTSPVSLEIADEGDLVNFTGLCVYSQEGFSVLYNGEDTIVVYETLDMDKTYEVMGKLLDESKHSVEVFEINETSHSTLILESLQGAFWIDYSCYLLTPQKIKLSKCLNANKGEMVDVYGLFYGSEFHVVDYIPKGFLKTPMDKMPFKIKGVVIRNTTPATIWNGSKEFNVYLPYKTKLALGDKVEVLGTARLYSTLTIYVNSPEDVKVIGKAKTVPIGKERIGEIAHGVCQVTKTGVSLSLNCTELKLYGFSANFGDIIEFHGIRRKNSLYCIKCTVKIPREKLPNSICSPLPNVPLKIQGKVEWVKQYKNGFGLANVTDKNCWILLKLPKSLGISLETNQTITAFGFYTTYREKPAFEIPSRDDICLNGSC